LKLEISTKELISLFIGEDGEMSPEIRKKLVGALLEAASSPEMEHAVWGAVSKRQEIILKEALQGKTYSAAEGWGLPELRSAIRKAIHSITGEDIIGVIRKEAADAADIRNQEYADAVIKVRYDMDIKNNIIPDLIDKYFGGKIEEIVDSVLKKRFGS
jgi:hypothetical protein